MKDEQRFKKLLKQIQKMKDNKEIDLSLEEDLSLGIMNLVSLEEHFFFTAQKTKKDQYYDWLNEVRGIRKELLAQMVPQHEGETWCVTKHLLAATMRLVEVGTKYLSDEKRQEAKDMFEKAYKVYSIFWAVRLGLIKLSGFKKIDSNQLNKHDKNPTGEPWKVEDIMNKLVDCCDE